MTLVGSAAPGYQAFATVLPPGWGNEFAHRVMTIAPGIVSKRIVTRSLHWILAADLDPTSANYQFVFWGLTRLYLIFVPFLAGRGVLASPRLSAVDLRVLRCSLGQAELWSAISFNVPISAYRGDLLWAPL